MENCMGRKLYVRKEPAKSQKGNHFKKQQSDSVDPFAQEHINFVEEIPTATMSDSPRQLTEPELEPPAAPCDYVSSSEDSAEVEARYHRLLECAQDTENLEPHVIEALQALAMTIEEEEEQDEEERVGPVVRDYSKS